ncbi:hypothetical protein [Bacteroides reticulotermitis]|uniref:hypothetical protein n=1 Tax=Bacteroides reticulotermitis TaxID=1133319 RepID=UPI003A8A7E2A
MKKITKKDLRGLEQLFPVLEKEEMRRCVGGSSGGYYGDDWLNHGFGSYDPYGNYYWHSGYTQDEFNNWEGTWYGGWVYGLGYVYPDVNIYGYQGEGGSGYYGYAYYDDGYYGEDDGNKRGAIIESDWACMFNCMNYLDSSRSAEEYYEYFTSIFRIDASEVGGIPYEYHIAALKACGFSCEETNSMTVSGKVTYEQLAIIDPGNGRTHAVIIKSIDENGNANVYDPTLGKPYPIDIKKRICTIYRVEKK